MCAFKCSFLRRRCGVKISNIINLLGLHIDKPKTSSKVAAVGKWIRNVFSVCKFICLTLSPWQILGNLMQFLQWTDLKSDLWTIGGWLTSSGRKYRFPSSSSLLRTLFLIHLSCCRSTTHKILCSKELVSLLLSLRSLLLILIMIILSLRD